MYSKNPPAPHDRTLVLLSGGLDSAVALALARQNTCNKLLAISFDYKQRHSKELACAKTLAYDYSARHYVIPMPALDLFTGLRKDDDVRQGHSRHPEHIKGAEDIARLDLPLLPSTWKPGRNILFFSFAGAFAWWEGVNLITCGIHSEEQPGYPDCREEFLWSMERSLRHGLSYTLNIWAPLLHLRKYEIVKLGLRLGVPFKKTWSCYAGEAKPCRECDACKRREQAFLMAGSKDPLL